MRTEHPPTVIAVPKGFILLMLLCIAFSSTIVMILEHREPRVYLPKCAVITGDVRQCLAECRCFTEPADSKAVQQWLHQEYVLR